MSVSGFPSIYPPGMIEGLSYMMIQYPTKTYDVCTQGWGREAVCTQHSSVLTEMPQDGAQKLHVNL